MTYQFATVILDIALDKPLDYSIPENLQAQIKPGIRVLVPVKGHLQKAFVVSLKNECSFSKVHPIDKVTSNDELITPHLFEVALWMSKYYCTPLRQVLRVILPASVRKDMKHKEQFYVMRNKDKDELKEFCEKNRNKFTSQTNVLDVMLKVTKGVLLTELLERADCSRSAVDSLVKKGFLTIDIVRVDRSPLVNEEYFKTKQKILSDEQKSAFEKIKKSIEKSHFETHLLFGVTGSGKTEIYLQAIEKALSMGKGTIMLVPEIALTAQTIERFRARFDEKIAILHHRLSDGERFDEWHKIRRGESSIVIGARSAVFCPVPNLGLIIVDEEHEQSYKQTDEQPCYNARDIAVMRAKMSNSTVVLGSATPSLESFQNALSSKYTMSKLIHRPNSLKMPEIRIVDMQKEFEKNKGFTSFSSPLIDEIKTRYQRGEQSILFLNRRGYHTTLMCEQCREPVKCNDCDVSMTYHLSENSLCCHLCGYQIQPTPKFCPKCKSESFMKFKGVGTELIEKNLHAILPGIRTIRMDADTTKHKGSHQKLLKNFSSGKADVLIGTQMIAKGLHFPSVTLVGVINCDGSLNLPDFRASENVFQLITQVSGRAGRGDLPGVVILQTSLPENSTIKLASSGNYEKFFEEEIAVRRLFNYPPFVNMVKIAFSGLDEKKVSHFAETTLKFMKHVLGDQFEWHPVMPGGYTKVKGKYRFQFLMRGNNIYLLNRALENFRERVKKPLDIKMKVDVNPSSTF